MAVRAIYLGIIVCPDLFAPINTADEIATEVPAVKHLLIELPVHQTCAENLECSASILLNHMSLDHTGDYRSPHT